MATAKPNEPEQPTIDPASAPVKPSEARKRFLAGEIGWNEYIALESATDAETETKPAAKPK